MTMQQQQQQPATAVEHSSEKVNSSITQRKRRTSVSLLCTLVIVLVFCTLGNELLNSYQATSSYFYAERSRFAAELAVPEAAAAAAAATIVMTNESAASLNIPLRDAEAAMEKVQRNLNYAYADAEEMGARSSRFPSVEDRVKLYMSNWYTPPCNDEARVAFEYSTRYDIPKSSSSRNSSSIRSNNSSAADQRVAVVQLLTLREIEVPSEQKTPRIFQINSNFVGSSVPGSFDQVHFLDREAMLECGHRYCKDMVEFLYPSLEYTVAAGVPVPILFQFGDDNRTKATLLLMRPDDGNALSGRPRPERYPNMPVLKKIRKSIRARELQRLTEGDSSNSTRCFKRGGRIVPEAYHLEPIVFKLKTQRHYGRIHHVAALDVVPWEKKKNVAIFRGELNGNYPVDYVGSGTILKQTVHERCRLLERCWISYLHNVAKNSTLVDAKLTLPFSPNKMIPRFMERRDGSSGDGDGNKTGDLGVDLYGDSVSMVDMLQYKALIMLEGNDVSSGLKWALFSNSVVLIPEPTLTSWAMEERLEPWVHYVPITVVDKDNDDTANDGAATTRMTDVEEKMQWIIDNDDKARQIARAGKLWIADLVLHPDVRTDEKAIFDEIAQRYATHFVPAAAALAAGRHA